MSYPKPPESRSAIRKAGKRVAAGNHEQTDADLVDQWRSSHGYVLNTFQAWLKRHIAKQSYPIEFAQRLKRRRTVFDKLTRRKPDGSHLISDVTAMHDHAGCRLIFENLDNLNDFRKYMRSNGVTRNVRHKFRDEDEPDKYNYILAPKLTGYRGIHDVYRHLPRRHRRDETMNNPWDGLFVEV